MSYFKLFDSSIKIYRKDVTLPGIEADNDNDKHDMQEDVSQSQTLENTSNKLSLLNKEKDKKTKTKKQKQCYVFSGCIKETSFENDDNEV